MKLPQQAADRQGVMGSTFRGLRTSSPKFSPKNHKHDLPWIDARFAKGLLRRHGLTSVFRMVCRHKSNHPFTRPRAIKPHRVHREYGKVVDVIDVLTDLLGNSEAWMSICIAALYQETD
jgi:hypothetical protein